MIDLAVGVAGLVIAAVALWLGVKFFQISETSSNRLAKSSTDIESAVKQLNVLITSLHSDTFALLRDTMGDFRAHAWGESTEKPDVEEAIDERVNEKVRVLKVEMESRIEGIAEALRSKDIPSASIETQVKDLLDAAITRGRSVDSEAKAETIREVMARNFTSLESIGPVHGLDIIRSLLATFDFSSVADELSDLKRLGVLEWQGDLRPDTIIHLNRDQLGRGNLW